MALKGNPPFQAPAAPLGAGEVQIIALRDVSAAFIDEDGKKAMRVVHPKGSTQTLAAPTAREVVRSSPEDYAYLGEADVEQDTHPQLGTPIEPGAMPSPINAMLQQVPPHPDLDPEAPGTIETGEGTGAPTVGPNSGEDNEISVADIPGVGEHLGRTLGDAGFDSIEKIADADPEELQKIEGVGPAISAKIQSEAKKLRRRNSK